MRLDEFNDIESYFNSYKARYLEVVSLNSHMKNRKILIMHLGGVVIECLLKHKAIKDKNIVKRYTKNYWYTQNNVDLLLTLGNVKNKDRFSYGIKNPGHDLKEIAKLHSILNSKLSTEEQFIKDLDIIYNPLSRENETFIDLRYINDDDINNLDERFNHWNEAFKRVHNVINI